MDNTVRRHVEEISSKEITSQERPQRIRSLTTLKLQWLAERARKAERIKRAIADGTYKVDSQKIAKALLWLD